MIYQCIILFICFLWNTSTQILLKQSNQQNATVLDSIQYIILNEGQSLKISLQQFFPFSQNFSVLEDQSSENITDVLNINFNLDKLQVQASQNMSNQLNNQTIDLSEYRILDVKTIYNQPNKIFLLEKNILMMYSYREKSQSKLNLSPQYQEVFDQGSKKGLKDYPKVTVFNITAQANIVVPLQSNFSCIQTEAIPLQSYYNFIVLCKMQSTLLPQIKTNYIISFNMEQDNRGFITNLQFNSSVTLQNKLQFQLQTDPGKHSNDQKNQPQDKQNLQNKQINQRNIKKSFVKTIIKRLVRQKLKTVNNTQNTSEKIKKIKHIKRNKHSNKHNTSKLQNKTNINAPQICQQYHIKYFDNIVIEQLKLCQTIIAFCNSSSQQSSIKQVFQIKFNKNKVFAQPIINMQYLNITGCLLNSKYITQYENGFVSVISNFLYKYTPKINARGRYQSKCQSFNSVSLFEYKFITSRNQSGVQIIYIIFKDKIMIFQSYSPNYQTLFINSTDLILKSYAISNQILSLHYQDSQSQRISILAYNIKTIFPHLIDKVQYPIKPNTGIYLFSVMNYLQKGNYFFIYQRARNLFNLTFYDGQYVNITIKNPQKAVGVKIISIINTTITNKKFQKEDDNNTLILPIILKIRDFYDTSIETVQLEQVKINNKFFNIDLVKAVIGPLGRFYKMTNPMSTLQFVNSFHQIDISEILNTYQNKKLVTFSINTFLKDPILTFFFQNSLFLNCDLQFDYDMMRPMITRCIKITDMQDTDNVPEQIIIYEQGKFIQHEGHRIQFCKISSNSDAQCIDGDFQQKLIKKIKLIKYYELDDGSQFISIFIIFQNQFKQKDYIRKANAVHKQDIQIFTNLQIAGDQIQYLKNMRIKTVQYDEGYSNFLLLYMVQHFNPVTVDQQQFGSDKYYKLRETDFSIIQIYSKPQLQTNQTSRFVGHLIQQFVSTELQGVFIIDNKVILLFILQNGLSTIDQYVIQNFKCTKSRVYPLYHHVIVKNGSHTINSGFLFVQVQDPQLSLSKYLVYNPYLNTTNIITHSFQKAYNQNIMFSQKIQATQNVMAINGNKLITLCLPNIVIKLNQTKKSLSYSNNQNSLQPFNPDTNFIDNFKQSDIVKVSFIDNNDILKILEFKYFYDISDSKIQYNHSFPQQKFVDQFASFQLEIDPTKISGPVAEYNMQNLTKISTGNNLQQASNLCQFLILNSSDIFTKTKCIKYYNAKQDGIMQDFLTFQRGLYDDISLIVTDRKILCVQSMKIMTTVLKNKTKQCNLEMSQYIFLVCVQNNRTSMNMIHMYKNCQINLFELPKPAFLKYNLFKMTYTSGQAIFQVPIRSENNKVYYVTKFFIQNNTFDQNFIILKNQSQEEFSTKDFTTNYTFMYLLQDDGLGIFNLSRRNQVTKKITPDVWITGTQLRKKFGVNQQFQYVNFLNFSLNDKTINLQIGTTLRSFQVAFKYSLINNTFRIDNMSVLYVYRNPWSCFNTLLSKSRYYKTMTIKMCSFMPQQHYIFSNFIPITQNKQNSYIIFYQKNFQKNESYPFRMDIIYTNIYSNDNFQIPFEKGILLIGSLFNLLCEYDLRDSYKFTFSVNKKIKQYVNSELIDNQEMKKKDCHFNLNLSNQNSQTLYPIKIKIDFSDKNDDMWTDWKHWIQRVVFLALIINFVRLQLKKRQEQHRVIKIKTKRSRSDSFDQEFDLQVRFRSKKSL